MRLLKDVILASVLLIASPAPSHWVNAFVDTVTSSQIRKETVLQSLDIDSLDYVHLVWRQIRDEGGWNIFYSTNSPAGIWLTPQCVSDSTQRSSSPSLAVSPISNQPFIAYEQGSEIFIVHLCEGKWKRHKVTSNSHFDCAPAIALDSSGFVHLAWITDDPTTKEYKISYALGDSTNWEIQTLAGSNLGPYGMGASPQIAVSPQGSAHIVYRGGTYEYYHIHHAWNDTMGGNKWNYEVMTSGNLNDFSSSLVVEENGDLHLAVSGYPSSVYYFYQPQGQNWEPFELASSSYSAVRPSIDIDEYGSPHIIWMETSGDIYTGNIFYSHKDAKGNWQVSFVIGKDHGSPSFKVDHQGFGHVAYNTGANTGIYDVYHIRSAYALTSIEELPSQDEGFSCHLSQNRPNPFRFQTTIDYTIPIGTDVVIKIYSITGQTVKSIRATNQKAGAYRVIWDGRDNKGQRLASGIYFYRLEAGNFTAAKKLTVLK